jgi:hypothetical protein
MHPPHIIKLRKKRGQSQEAHAQQGDGSGQDIVNHHSPSGGSLLALANPERFPNIKEPKEKKSRDEHLDGLLCEKQRQPLTQQLVNDNGSTIMAETPLPSRGKRNSQKKERNGEQQSGPISHARQKPQDHTRERTAECRRRNRSKSGPEAGGDEGFKNA